MEHIRPQVLRTVRPAQLVLSVLLRRQSRPHPVILVIIHHQQVRVRAVTAQLEASVQAVQPLCHVLRANSVIYEMVFAPTVLLVSIVHPLDQLAAHHVPKVMSVRQLEHPHQYHVMQAMWPHKAHRAVQYVLMIRYRMPTKLHVSHVQLGNNAQILRAHQQIAVPAIILFLEKLSAHSVHKIILVPLMMRHQFPVVQMSMLHLAQRSVLSVKPEVSVVAEFQHSVELVITARQEKLDVHNVLQALTV